jgi:hypothetical protein
MAVKWHDYDVLWIAFVLAAINLGVILPKIINPIFCGFLNYDALALLRMNNCLNGYCNRTIEKL